MKIVIVLDSDVVVDTIELDEYDLDLTLPRQALMMNIKDAIDLGRRMEEYELEHGAAALRPTIERE